jgi:hypothetical protein
MHGGPRGAKRGQLARRASAFAKAAPRACATGGPHSARGVGDGDADAQLRVQIPQRLTNLKTSGCARRRSSQGVVACTALLGSSRRPSLCWARFLARLNRTACRFDANNSQGGMRFAVILVQPAGVHVVSVDLEARCLHLACSGSRDISLGVELACTE